MAGLRARVLPSAAFAPQGKPKWRRGDQISTQAWTTTNHQVHLEAGYSSETRIEELKNRVRDTLRVDPCSTRTMRLVDRIHRLGISHLFEDQIELIFDQNRNLARNGDDLHGTALRFRLLRQQGHNPSTDVFHKFMDKKGRFEESLLSRDLKGLLSLHEAAYMSARNEEVLLQAMEFSKESLERLMPHLNPFEARDVAAALDFPRHRRMARAEARSYIMNHRALQRDRTSLDLLELATLDFNSVQSQLRTEIATLKSWWKELGLAEKLSFARDRPLECYLWTVGLFPDPRLSRCRVEIAKTVAILLVIDDVYDTYASLEELVLFTNAVKRWGVEAMEGLPEYMKICYMALYNTTNEIGFRVLKEHGMCFVPELRQTWVDLCEAFLVEAKWYNGGVVPGLEEYIDNGVTTAGTYMALVHAFYLMGSGAGHRKSSELANSRPKLFTSAGRILRLWDDLGTAKEEQERGDVASSMQCYAKEVAAADGDAEEESRAHIRSLIHGSWLDLNGEALSSSLPRSIVDVSLNLARASQAVYQSGDDERVPGVKQHISSLLLEPITVAV